MGDIGLMPTLPYSPNFDASPSQSSGLLVAQGSAMAPTIAAPDVLRIYGDEPYARDCVRDDTVGHLSPPSQKQQRPGIIGGIRIPCDAGKWLTLRMFCKFSPVTPPCPRMIVRANPLIGLGADIIVDAPATGGWAPLDVQILPSADGVVEVLREQRQPGTTNWDALQVWRS